MLQRMIRSVSYAKLTATNTVQGVSPPCAALPRYRFCWCRCPPGLPQRDQAPEELVRRADRAMYRAKQAGRNRIELAPD